MTLFPLVFVLLAAITSTAQATQVNFNSYLSKQISNDNYLMTKDTAHDHYQSAIDDILSEHNEGLLTELSFIIKDPKEMYNIMKPQADVLYGIENDYPIEDVCVAQMPGMIANQIHELSNEIYSSIDVIVSKNWKQSDEYYRKVIVKAIDKGLWEHDILDKIIQTLEVVNMDITDHITKTVDHFDILNKLKNGLEHCHAVFGQDTTKQDTTSTFTEKIWDALLFSIHFSNDEQKKEHQQNGFMGRYIFDLRADIQSELYSSVHVLARAIYQDLAFTS